MWWRNAAPHQTFFSVKTNQASWSRKSSLGEIGQNFKARRAELA